VPEGSKAIGSEIGQLGLPEDVVVVALLRAGKVLFPKTDLALQQDDRVLLLTTVEREQRVAEMLA
nr:hypothetical protein [Dehalococcoidales bacterium]